MIKKNNINKPTTIADILSKGNLAKNKKFAFFSNNESLTFKEHFDSAKRVANRIKFFHHLENGSRIAILSDTNQNLLAALSGCWLSRMIVSPIDKNMPFEGLKQVLNNLKPNLIFINDFDSEKKSDLEKYGYVFDDLRRQKSWSDLFAPDVVKPSDPALVIFTSGSTGIPKGVLLTQSNLLTGANNVIKAKGLTSKDRAMCVLPLSHLNGLMTTYLSPLVSQSSVVFYQKTFESLKVLQLIDKFNCTWLSCVPMQYNSFLRPPIDKSLWSLKSLRFCRSASASLRPDIRKNFESHYGIPIIETMGMSETSAQIFSNPLPPYQRLDGSIGKPVGFEVRIVDEKGNILSANQDGEIQIKGKGIMKCYLDDKEETSKAFDGEWLKSGDIAYFNEEGYYFITGRKKEIIIFSGINISLVSIQNYILQADLVESICCIGEPDNEFGERIVAYISLNSSSQLIKEKVNNVRERIEDVLPNRQALKEIRVVEDIPTNKIGKILRSKLLEKNIIYSSQIKLPNNPKGLLSHILGLKEKDLFDDVCLGSIKEWDSLAHACLIIEIESLIKRTLNETEILTISSLRGIKKVLEGTKLNEKEDLSNLNNKYNPELIDLMIWNKKFDVERKESIKGKSLLTDNPITKDEFCEVLSKSGLNPGDSVLIHSDITTFGITTAGLRRDQILKFYISCFQDVITDKGTLFVCTSFEDYGRYGSPFIVEESPSRIGALSEYIRTLPGAIRSFHPIVSITGVGPAAKEVCGGNHYDGFGYDSPWGRLHRMNAKLMTIGMWKYPEFGMTFIHYIEHLYGVPYQYNKIFNAPVIFKNREIEGPFTMSVRFRDFDIAYSTNNFRDHLVKENYARCINFKNDMIFLIEANDIVEAGMQFLQKNRYGFLEKPPLFRLGEIPMDGTTGKIKYKYNSKESK